MQKYYKTLIGQNSPGFFIVFLHFSLQVLCLTV